MTPSTRLLKQPQTFRRLTGLTPVAFERLLTDVTAAWEAAQSRRGQRAGRKRRPGAGHPFTLASADQLLMYYRTYVPHTFLGFLFGVDDSTVCRGNRRIEPLLAGHFRIPERKVELSQDEIQERFFDATERPTNRPEQGQRAYDSGKKKRHTIKHQVVVVQKKKTGRGQKPRRLRIACVSKSFAGSTHDKRVYDRTGVKTPKGVPVCGDTAYQGTGMETPTRGATRARS